MEVKKKDVLDQAAYLISICPELEGCQVLESGNLFSLGRIDEWGARWNFTRFMEKVEMLAFLRGYAAAKNTRFVL